jgi:hypothetical protein
MLIHSRTSQPTSIPPPLSAPQHLIYSDASSSTAAFSHVAPRALHNHLAQLPTIRTAPLTQAEYRNDIQHTSSFLPDPSLHINSKEALALSSALQYARQQRVPDALFAVDSEALFGAVRKGRSNNPENHSAAILFNSLRADGLRPRLQWTSTKNNFADVPTRVALGSLDSNIII